MKGPVLAVLAITPSVTALVSVVLSRNRRLRERRSRMLPMEGSLRAGRRTSALRRLGSTARSADTEIPSDSTTELDLGDATPCTSCHPAGVCGTEPKVETLNAPGESRSEENLALLSVTKLARLILWDRAAVAGSGGSEKLLLSALDSIAPVERHRLAARGLTGSVTVWALSRP